MASVEIISVHRRSDIKTFINLPWHIYEGDPNWVPPIKSDISSLLNPKKHPFWTFSERELFLAMRGSEVVGRIAAIVDHNYNRYHKENMGIWGFFECEYDPEAAAALFTATEKWVRARDMQFLRGPLNPSTNYEVGILIHGFDSPPTLMMPYNPPYYPELVHLCGFHKEKDLFAYRFSRDYEPPKWALSLANRMVSKSEISIKKFDRTNLKADLRMMNRIYNECWAHNWGFVPMTDEEIEYSAKGLLPIMDSDFVFFLYHKDDAIGVCLILPDVNPLLKRIDGRLGLSALIKKYLYWSEIKGLRGLMLGVKKQYRQMGAPWVALDHLMRKLRSKDQYQYLELGWNLEDNQAINQLYEEGGAKPSKRFRIYRKNL